MPGTSPSRGVILVNIGSVTLNMSSTLQAEPFVASKATGMSTDKFMKAYPVFGATAPLAG
jgi:hypothetical protein